MTGTIYCLITPSLFTASAKLVAKVQKNKIAQIADMAGLAGVNFGANEETNPSDYLNEVIYDKDFLIKLIERKWWINNDSIYLKDLWKIKIDTNKFNWEYSYKKQIMDRIRIKELIKLKKDQKSNVLTLTTTFNGAQMAYDINIYLINLITDYVQNTMHTQVYEKRIFVENRIGEIKKELTKCEDELTIFRERNYMSSTPKNQLEESRLLQQVAINQEVYLQLRKQYELIRIEEKNDHAMVEVIKHPELPLIKTYPKNNIIMVLSVLCGIVIGCFTAIFLDIKNKGTTN